MIKKLVFGLCASTVLLPPSIANETKFERDTVADQSIVEIYLPTPEQFGGSDYRGLSDHSRELFHMYSNGKLLHQAKLTDLERVKNFLPTLRLRQEKVEVSFEADSIQSSESVFAFLKIIMETETEGLGFVGLTRYNKIVKPNDVIPYNPKYSSEFLEKYPAHSAIIVVSALDSESRNPGEDKFSGPSVDGHCRVYFNGEPVSGFELSDKTTSSFEAAFEALGGIEAVENGVVMAADFPRYMIYAQPDVPWRCIGGAISNLHQSGVLLLELKLNHEGPSTTPLDPHPIPR